MTIGDATVTRRLEEGCVCGEYGLAAGPRAPGPARLPEQADLRAVGHGRQARVGEVTRSHDQRARPRVAVRGPADGALHAIRLGRRVGEVDLPRTSHGVRNEPANEKEEGISQNKQQKDFLNNWIYAGADLICSFTR